MGASAYDLVILGGGAAAFAAATEAENQGRRTLMINAGLPLGGTCVNVGCVPTKHFLALAKELHSARHPRFEGITPTSPVFDFGKAMEEKERLVGNLRRLNYQDVLQGFRHVEWVDWRAAFVSERLVQTGGRKVEGGQILIATGCRTLVPPIAGLKEAGFLTYRSALSLQRLPSSLLILGGGPIGLEFAQIFARFGVTVTILEAAERIAGTSEPEISQTLQRYLEDEGIAVRTGAQVAKVHRTLHGKEITAAIGGRQERFVADDILVATGMRGNIEALGLGRIGVETLKNSFVRVNECLQTNVPHIWAAGDVVGHMCLETVAAKEGKLAVENAFLGAGKKVDLDQTPWAIFTDPEVAGVGMTEAAFVARHGACECRTVDLNQVPKAVAVNDTRGLVKMVADPETEIVGVHILGPQAAEMIHEATLAVRFALSVDDLIETTHVFPTFSEAIKLAAQAFRRDISRMSCCVE